MRETSSKIEIQLDARHLVTHQRIVEAERRHVMLAEHRPPRGVKRPDPHPEEALILKAVPEIAGYVAALKQHSRKLVVLALRQLLNRLSRLDVLLVDELGYLTLKPEQSNIFFKLMEERYHRHSTIITTNLSYDEWSNFLGNPTMVDALLSRVRHYCHTIQIDRPSLRDPQG